MSQWEGRVSLYIDIDVNNCSTIVQFIDKLLLKLGAPQGHGKSVDALIDSMIYGEMNAIEAPYTVRIHNLETATPELRRDLNILSKYIIDAGDERLNSEGVDMRVKFEFL